MGKPQTKISSSDKDESASSTASSGDEEEDEDEGSKSSIPELQVGHIVQVKSDTFHPFVGCIINLTKTDARVQWLYRPSELKMKSSTIRSSELFYFSHSDVVPRLSVLKIVSVRFSSRKDEKFWSKYPTRERPTYYNYVHRERTVEGGVVTLTDAHFMEMKRLSRAEGPAKPSRRSPVVKKPKLDEGNALKSSKAEPSFTASAHPSCPVIVKTKENKKEEPILVRTSYVSFMKRVIVWDENTNEKLERLGRFNDFLEAINQGEVARV